MPEWAFRGGLAAGALLLGYWSIAASLANSIVRREPATAHLLAPSDGRFTAKTAEREFSVSPSSDLGSEQARLAKRALQQDPTAVEALTVLGLQAQLRSDVEIADRLLGYSHRLSRRELQPQLWAIEQAVNRGDIQSALRNYDLAMRTSNSAQNLLFPALASALSEPRIRAPLVNILAEGPIWAERFIAYIPSSGADPAAAAAFYQEASSKSLSITNAERAGVVSAFVRRQLPDEAWAYYTTFRRNVARDRSRDPNFSLRGDAITPFDWRPGTARSLSAALLRDGKNGVLDFAVPANTRATAVRQLQLLPPGRYRLYGRARGLDQPPASHPYWVLTCNGGKELGRVNVPNSSVADSSFTGDFVVPEGCTEQTLSLLLRASDRVSGVSGQITYLLVAPADSREGGV